MAQKTHKNFVIVAPTGIAALNANGVTIHSQFQLPFGSFVPDDSAEIPAEMEGQFYTEGTLAYRGHLSAAKRQVIRAIELLIIDEVSMLRADILDAIDYRLRVAKGRRQESFGGVQVLMIGDLYQLPPIVRPQEWRLLSKYYKSMHFFEAKALKNDEMVFLELDKIFRQADNAFISILNNLRNDHVTAADLEVLNARYRSEEEIRKEGEVIRLTTHNRKADRINAQELAALKGDPKVIHSEVEDVFPENTYPLPARLELKEGAQVMFIKNDRSGAGRYYNGKLAQVTSLVGDQVKVRLADSETELTLEKEVWENKKYHLDPKTKHLEEEVVGTFTQYPIKLAWAVTIHKCQGLTFDKAIIDVEAAFAPGQVYVAMSRLRSLDGLILSSRLSSEAVSTDPQVVAYSKMRSDNSQLQETLSSGQEDYLKGLLERTFDFSPIASLLRELQQSQGQKMEFEDEEMRTAVDAMMEAFMAEQANTRTFSAQLAALLARQERAALVERLDKGSAYYTTFLEQRLKEVVTHLSQVEQFSRTKAYLAVLSEVDEAIVLKMNEIDRLGRLTEAIMAGRAVERSQLGLGKSGLLRARLLESARAKAEAEPKRVKGRSGRKKRTGKKRKKGETYLITYGLLDEGKDITAVAKERGLAESTIEGHVARGIGEGRLELADFLKEEEVEEIRSKIDEGGDSNSVFAGLGGKYSFTQIRMVTADRERKEQVSDEG